MSAALAVGLLLALVSALALNWGFFAQQRAAAAAPRLSVRRPLESLAMLFRARAWLAGFVVGLGGWALYVAALRLAPLSLVQAVSAGGIGVLAVVASRSGGQALSARDRSGVAAALAGLALLGVSLGGASAPAGHGSTSALAGWLAASLALAGVAAASGRGLAPGAGLGVSAGVLYAAGDVATKGALLGGGRVALVPVVLLCHGLGFAALQVAFQQGGALATAGVAGIWTNALPIVAGSVVYGEAIPRAGFGAARLASFALVVAGAALLVSRRASRPSRAMPGPSVASTRLDPNGPREAWPRPGRIRFFVGAEGTSATVGRRRARPTARQKLARRLVAAAAAVAACGIGVGVVFAGSPEKLAAGVRISGVDVGGLTPGAARSALSARAFALRHTPVTFTAAGHSWHISPGELGVQVDWRAAVDAARAQGDGFAPVRGYRRIGMRMFGADVSPPVRVWNQALKLELRRIAAAVDRAHADAALRLRGLHVVVEPARDGRALDRSAAAPLMVRALASFARTTVALPVRVDPPAVVAANLAPAAAQARRALAAPVRLALGPTRWVVPRWRLARLLQLPHDGARSLAIAGSAADRFLARLSDRVSHPPSNADFAVTPTAVRIVPDRDGIVLDTAAARRALLAGAVGRRARVARLHVVRRHAARTAAQARAMGITGLVGTYETIYGGDPNRIHNVQLVAHLIDRKLIAPGATFSFNRTTGERTADKGFREAPVIINGELQTGLGGGVCQVSTTVFNAAYEAGLDITDRTNHSLYISHYPLARDATVNYPDTDLKFVNDTPHWLLVRTFVGSYSLTVSLYGTPVHRRVVSHTTPLVSDGPVPVTRVEDASLYQGQSATDAVGSPPLTTSVRRLVYSPRGNLLHDNTWSSYYRGEPTVIRVGSKQRPKPKPKPAPPPADTTTTAPDTTTTAPDTTTTAPTTTAPTPGTTTTPSGGRAATPLVASP